MLILLGTLAAGSAARPGRAPTIVAQETKMVMHERESPTWERSITIKNPLDRAVWVYIECERNLTVNPIGLAGRHTTTITLPDVPPQDQCLLNHWKRMGNETIAPEWRP